MTMSSDAPPPSSADDFLVDQAGGDLSPLAGPADTGATGLIPHLTFPQETLEYGRFHGPFTNE